MGDLKTEEKALTLEAAKGATSHGILVATEAGRARSGLFSGTTGPSVAL